MATWLTANPTGPLPLPLPEHATDLGAHQATGYDTTIYGPRLDARSRPPTRSGTPPPTPTTRPGTRSPPPIPGARSPPTATTGKAAPVSPRMGLQFALGLLRRPLLDDHPVHLGRSCRGDEVTYTYYPGDTTDIITTEAGTTADTYDTNGDLTGVSYSPTPTAGTRRPPTSDYTFFADGSRTRTMTDGTGAHHLWVRRHGRRHQPAEVRGRKRHGPPPTRPSTTATTPPASWPRRPIPPTPGPLQPDRQLHLRRHRSGMTSESDWLGNEVTFAQR